ncbi:MAG: hypothetical protein CVV27_13560 [Candidatus Melainabacteria bacterium HGW-Melainabacteria-1]|nr:MAG: hypothetical protein CVV27_13560 [Candidatus Melainabacteria bacterium HGW-Melainabacteria-1]
MSNISLQTNISAQRVIDSTRISTHTHTPAEPAKTGSLKSDTLELQPSLKKVPKGMLNGAMAGSAAAAVAVALPAIVSTWGHHDGSVGGGMMLVGAVATAIGAASGAAIGGTAAGLSDNKWNATAIGAGMGAVVLGGIMFGMSQPSMMNIGEGAALFIGLASAAGAVVGGSSAYAGALAAKQ